MFTVIKNNLSRSTVITILCISLSGCANDDYEAISSMDRREIPVVQADAEVNSKRVGDVSISPVLPTESVNSEDTGDDTLMVQRLNLIQYAYNISPRQACEYTAEKTFEGSRLSYEAQGGYQILQIDELQVVNDFRKTFPLPGPGEKIIVMKCNSLSRFDVDGVIYEGRMMIYLLVDDLGQNRARWEPDLSTVKKVG